MSTQGEDIAEALLFMGLKPEWHPKNGRVTGVQVVPLEELEFALVDLTSLQNITERLLEAISRGMWQADQETK